MIYRYPNSRIRNVCKHVEGCKLGPFVWLCKYSKRCKKDGNDLELRLCIFGVAQHVRAIRSHTIWMGLPRLAVWRPGCQTCSPGIRKVTFKNRANGPHPLRRIYIEARKLLDQDPDRKGTKKHNICKIDRRTSSESTPEHNGNAF